MLVSCITVPPITVGVGSVGTITKLRSMKSLCLARRLMTIPYNNTEARVMTGLVEDQGFPGLA